MKTKRTAKKTAPIEHCWKSLGDDFVSVRVPASAVEWWTKRLAVVGLTFDPNESGVDTYVGNEQTESVLNAVAECPDANIIMLEFCYRAVC